MVETANIYLWGKHVASIALNKGDELMSFRYTEWAIENGINLSPIVMPVERRTYQFPDLLRSSFNGVPGLVSDSLPDKFGNVVINSWLIKQGRQPNTMSTIERLCYIGERGMGALEYRPQIGPNAGENQSVEISELVHLASSVLQQREKITIKTKKDRNLESLLKVGTSAGGARAKAIIAWNRTTNEIKSGQIKAGDGFEYWILKLDGVNENGDKEGSDSFGYGKIEYAYHLMAKDCNIDMMECRLFSENGRSHFMTKRFDRTDNGEKYHIQTLAALTHTDYNYPGIYSYEEAYRIIRILTNDQSQVEEQFRRMIFNVLAMNQDDHVKNISFIMDKNLNWKLSPAYDIGFAYNPNGNYTSKHQMTINGKQIGISAKDIFECGKNAGISKNRIIKICDEVLVGVKNWVKYANQTKIAEKDILNIKRMYPKLF